MIIISININDFGGAYHKLEEYKKIYGRREGWAEWRNIDKTGVINKLKNIVVEKKPVVFILHEFELNNSKEPMDFIRWMEDNGYHTKGSRPGYRISGTLLFVKSNNYSVVPVSHRKTELDARDCAVKVEDYIIYGTHVPNNSRARIRIREDYWDEIIEFYEEHKLEKVILIGDFNTFDKSTEAYRKYLELIEKGAYDLWLRLGNPDKTPTEKEYRGRLDYIFISPSAEEDVVSMDIDCDIMDQEEISDHAALYCELK